MTKAAVEGSCFPSPWNTAARLVHLAEISLLRSLRVVVRCGW